jgi:hypothetical protein
MKRVPPPFGFAFFSSSYKKFIYKAAQFIPKIYRFSSSNSIDGAIFSPVELQDPLENEEVINSWG